MHEPITSSIQPIAYSPALAPAIENDLEALGESYSFEQASDVIDWLQSHRSIVPLLLQAVQPLREHFGATAPLQLQVLTDEGSRSLFAVVLWKGPSEVASACLQSFDSGWWLEHSKFANGLVMFDYELV